MKQRYKKTFSIVVKAAVVILAFAFIVHKLQTDKYLADFKRIIDNLAEWHVKATLGAVISLMLVNWTLESFKWKFLVSRIEAISTWKAIESVFCGLTWAVFTPNRIGEYGGRVFFLSPRKRIFGIFAMGVGSAGQMVITNLLGGLALLWFITRFVELDNVLLHYAVAFLTFVFCAFFLLFYFNIRLVASLLNAIRFLKPFRKFFKVLASYPMHELLRVFLLSAGRFAVFTFQYYLVIHLLIPALPAFEMVMMVFILFFVQSALPSLDLLDVGVRSLTATYFFSYITDQQVAIMAAASAIWLVNLIIPAILGTIFVLKLRFF
ncbi:lysylphosphatidylglycerol synthase domain-containing protein [Hufsiella ginkgonis]|uniref:Flippase-like domain-containing protein n=1 Tax=Hufsiella ginkgonis TaxID=2695274 RepID=A0A7K1Y3R3_9SPHI|nr:lysylphosphatidylglycerol synthase domain-containing protein [Hufsiella ginkgonis]MXV17900.1 hypothetical protein [Hufsiella ginkgonis]